jgi:hypothetical protein
MTLVCGAGSREAIRKLRVLLDAAEGAHKDLGIEFFAQERRDPITFESKLGSPQNSEFKAR